MQRDDDKQMESNASNKVIHSQRSSRAITLTITAIVALVCLIVLAPPHFELGSSGLYTQNSRPFPMNSGGVWVHDAFHLRSEWQHQGSFFPSRSEQAVEAAKSIASHAAQVLREIQQPVNEKQDVNGGLTTTSPANGPKDVISTNLSPWAKVSEGVSFSGSENPLTLPISLRDKSPAALAVAAAAMASAAAVMAKKAQSQALSKSTVSKNDYLLFKPKPALVPHPFLADDALRTADATSNQRESELKDLARIKLRLKSLETSVDRLEDRVMDSPVQPYTPAKSSSPTGVSSRESRNPEADHVIEDLLRQVSHAAATRQASSNG